MTEVVEASAPGPRHDLRADCASCLGLCCVALTLTVSADFAIDKAAGEPCPNLTPEFGCGIHARLRPAGFKGCSTFDCFGAGQQVAQVTYAGTDWRQAPQTATEMFAVYSVMRQLQEMRWYVTEALERAPGGPVAGDLGLVLADLETQARGTPELILSLDIEAIRARVNVLLARTSDLVRRDALRTAGDRRPARRGPAIGRSARRGPARCVPDRCRPTRRGPAIGRPDRSRSPRHRPPRSGCLRKPVPHPAADQLCGG